MRFIKFLTSTAIVFAFLLGAGHVCAATFIVTNTNDAGLGSLRQAILDANAAASSDIIDFDPSSFASAQTILLTTGQLVVENNGGLTINGTGMNLLSISGNNQSRIMLVNSGINLTLNSLTFRNGSSGIGDGGGILRTGELNTTLTINNCRFTNNAAGGPGLGASGGAISNTGFGLTTINNSEIVNNTAGTASAGIQGGLGQFVMANSVVMGNVARSSAGGMSLASQAPGASISNSIIANNTTMFSRAGGIDNGGVLSLSNTIIYGNTAGGDGGGIYNSNLGTLTLSHCTVARNRAGTNGGDGGGVRNFNFTFGTETFRLKNSILSGNVRGLGAGFPNDARGNLDSQATT